MAGVFFKACPRCRGDLVLEDVEDEVVCLQCSYRTSAARVDLDGRPLAARPLAPRRMASSAAGR